MEYPKEFIERCKAAYPGAVGLHEALERGGRAAVRFLDDSRQRGVPAQLVLDDVEAAKALAREIIEKDELYRQWCKIDLQNTNTVSAQKEFFDSIGTKAANALLQSYGDLQFSELIATVVSAGWQILKVKGIGRNSFRSIAAALEKFGYVKSADDWKGAGGR